MIAPSYYRDDVHHYEGDIICCRMVMILMLKMLTKYQGDQGTKVMSGIMLWNDDITDGHSQRECINRG